MSWQTELQSWMFPSALPTNEVPKVGDKAPFSSKLSLPDAEGKPVIVTFLRHCGCPFAEKTYLSLCSAASKHQDVHFIAVSHSDAPSTGRWLQSLPGPSQDAKVDMIIDDERKVYAEWGLGVSSLWHVLSPLSMYEAFKLGKQEGVWNRPTESGSRWQRAGSFAVDGDGVVKWSRPSESADDVSNFTEALQALGKA